MNYQFLCYIILFCTHFNAPSLNPTPPGFLEPTKSTVNYININKLTKVTIKGRIEAILTAREFTASAYAHKHP